MAIPKVIYQTYSSQQDIPLLAKLHIRNMKRLNPEYEYRFYDDKAIEDFISEEFEGDVLEQYKKLDIGAAKADFFRYAVLLKKGGIYLDIDSRSAGKFSRWVREDDRAIITRERNPGFYVQWALVFEKDHPFLEKVVAAVLDNIRHNRFPHDVHQMTGPSVYSRVIDECIKEDDGSAYRILGVDYEGHLKFKYFLSGFTFRTKEHWRQAQQQRPVLKD